MKEIRYQTSKIVYATYGTGKPVMLVHGFGEERNVWDNQVEFLKDRYLLIVPDLPGSGQSELVKDMSMEGMAKVLDAILDKEKIEKCTMIGHSMGGYITLAFAELFPEKLNAFSLFHSTAFGDSDEKKESRRKGIKFIRENGAFEFLKTTTPNLFSPETKEKNPGLVEDQTKTLHNFTPDALVLYYESMINRPERTDILKNSSVPVLFVAGTSDNAIPLPDVLEQCHLPGLSYIHILEKSGHMGMMEESEESNRILEEFLL